MSHLTTCTIRRELTGNIWTYFSDPDPGMQRPQPPRRLHRGEPVNAQHPQNSNVQQVRTFSKQAVLNHVPRNLEEERLALRYLDKWAPDLVGCHHGWRAVTRDEIHQAMEDDRQEIIGAHYDALLQSRVLS